MVYEFAQIAYIGDKIHRLAMGLHPPENIQSKKGENRESHICECHSFSLSVCLIYILQLHQILSIMSHNKPELGTSKAIVDCATKKVHKTYAIMADNNGQTRSRRTVIILQWLQLQATADAEDGRR